MNKIQLIPSGIPLVDSAWGGFYRGGSYLLIGAHKSGRTLVSLQYAMECARQKEVCLYFTSMRPKDLMIQAASIDFDLQDYMNQNLIIVVRVAPPSDLYEVGNPDNFLAEYLRDIVTVVQQYQPNKIVFDELTPFVGFNDVRLLEDVFSHTIESIEEANITSLIVLGEPATPAAKNIVDALGFHTTGIIYLNKKELENGEVHGGKIIITPNIGHTEGKFSANYSVEPYKGVSVDYKPRGTVRPVESIPKTPEKGPELIPEIKEEIKTEEPEIDDRYTPLTELELPAESHNNNNFYSITEFNLILNNQIALFNSTGQIFTLVSLKIKIIKDKYVFTLNQLRNAVRLSTEKKDKICVFNEKVILLLTKKDDKSVLGILSRILNNLPLTEDTFEEAKRNIYVYTVKVSDKFKNADDMIMELMITEPKTEI